MFHIKIKSFRDRYPKINIVIKNSPHNTAEDLESGKVDIAVLSLPKTNTNDFEIIKSSKIQDCFVAGVSFKHLLDKPIELHQLTKYPLLLPSKGIASRDFLDEFAKSQGLTIKPDTEFTGHTVVLEMVKIGVGIGFGPRNKFDAELKRGELFELETKPSIPARYTCIAISKTKSPSPSLKKLLGIIRKKF